MNDHIEAFQSRLRKIFENKAEEFHRYAEENPATAPVTSQLEGLYNDLARVMDC